ARVILWDGRYAEAEDRFSALLAERPADANALLGYAQAAYWWGDFRAARTRYQRLLAVDSAHAEARQAIEDLSLLAAPRYEVSAAHLADSQPYRRSGASVVVSHFLDPLTRWDIRGLAGDVTDGDAPLASIGTALSVGAPRWRMHFDVVADWFRFPAGGSTIAGEVALTRRLPWRSALRLSAERTPLLSTAVSVDDHATVSRYTLGWQRDMSERWLAAVNVHALRYSDDNRGSGADGWVLAPLYFTDWLKLRAGISAATRDTELNRFRFTEFESRPHPDGVRWRYTYTGVYDPYWTPHDLQEARVVATAEWKRLTLHADGGYARDQALGFGPQTGFTPNPSFIFPHMQDRSFRPWRAGAEIRWPLHGSVELRVRYRHDVTVFYRANEFEASLGGRL
ncbi:MAG TPA: tetratricopeptide repeat protein, partial [Thermoanaerobaculia bacterium]|nr:tetratricopeptide repeat protein [Thermoanaerobaculia bacterium]